MYIQGHCVTAVVESAHPFGVFVRLDDGTRAYIRCQEMSLAGDIDPRELVAAGQRIDAKVVELASQDRLAELSVRLTQPDPWKEFARHFRVGSVVTATVKHLLPNGLYAQIWPGVEAVVPLRELAPWKVDRPDDVVWAGDQVEAIITSLDTAGKKIRLSIRQRLMQLAQVDEIVETLLPKASAAAAPEEESVAPELEEASRIVLTDPILIVEDDDEVREPLVTCLADQGYLVQGVKSAAEALNRCGEQNYTLILADMDMPEIDGLSLIHQLREARISAPVAVMSGPELIAEHYPQLVALEVSAAFPKPLHIDEILLFLLRLARGENLTWSPEGGKPPDLPQAQAFQSLPAVMRSRQPLAERFRQGLEQLVSQTQAEAGLVFRLDPASHQVSIVAQVGHLPLNLDAVYRLVGSPVTDVILRDNRILENRVLSAQAARFHRLLELLPFEACIGEPLHASGQTEYALFLFHRERDAFSRLAERDALAMASLFGVALESPVLDEHARALSRLVLSGELAAATSHEVYNKLTGLDLQFRNLHADLDRLARDHPDLARLPDFSPVKQASDEAAAKATDLKGAVEGLRQLMETKGASHLDVNHLVRQAESQIRPLARRAQVHLRSDLPPDLPATMGSGTGLYQVFLNLMLNAIQHMEKQPSRRRVLTVSTLATGPAEQRRVQVRFADTGPGIHRRLWDRIFTLGFTTRADGSGLGLFIARSLMESISGCILVEKSFVPLGTTFLVELPVSEQADATH